MQTNIVHSPRVQLPWGPRGPAWQWEHSVLLPADGSVSVRQLTWLEQYSPAQPVV